MKFFDMGVKQRAVCDGCSKRTWCGAWCQMPRCGTITVDREEKSAQHRSALLLLGEDD